MITIIAVIFFAGVIGAGFLIHPTKSFYFTIPISVIGLIATLALAPYYAVFQQRMAGKAELERAEQNRQIKVQEAKATKESATLLAQAEIERAKGVSEANKIIGDSLKGNEAYLRYLWIDSISKNQATIYVPTEAGLPILEAARMRK